MSWVADFALALGLMLGLLLGGMWIPFAIGVASVIAIVLSDGVIGLRALGLVTWGSVNSFTLTAIPLFILMADVLLKSGVSARFYDGLTKLVRALPGGLLQTNVAGCAMFSAISGSSVATAAAIGTVALPQLDRRKYSRPMAAGSLAAGGTLGILIPPSIPLIIYGTFTETSVARLFMAGLAPGVLLALIFMLFVGIRATITPELAPRETIRATAAERARALIDLAPFAILMLVVLGGIYFGYATPTEAGALGALLAIVIGAVWGRLTWGIFHEAMVSTVKVSCSLLFIVLTAFIFAYAVENQGISSNLSNWLLGLELPKYAFWVAVILMYVALGCVVDSIGMIVLTVPLLFPTITGFGFDPIWFGVMLVILVELGQITPPFGINLFVIQGIAGWPLRQVIVGAAPYCLIILAYVALLTAYPQIVLWLPAQMFDR